ncbi:MAG TPA: FtsX-like permease family protein, partial [Jatrophihabitans sp.]|nr:FtsX-like permease family protein [Jatrophihabitans sp.]
MIRLGLRLTLAGGKDAAIRLLLITVATAVGAGMLLVTLAGINAVTKQNDRYAWLETGSVPGNEAANSRSDPAWWLLNADEYRGHIIGRVDVAATGPHSPVPPGIPGLPKPGQFYASPALTTLLRDAPHSELAARIPGTEVGTIGAAALPAPDSLIAVVGRTPAQVENLSGAAHVTTISTVPPSSCNGSCYDLGIDASGIDLVLSVVAAALLFPVLIFIGTATRLSAARREQRFAAMRLVGATPRQISVIATVESTIAAAAGVVLGFVLFFATRPAIAAVPFTGARFFLGDLTLTTTEVLGIALGVPVAAALAARLALRRVTISPLGVTRRVTPQPPRAWRLVPLIAGLAELAYFVYAGRPSSTPGQIQAFLAGILIVMVGLVLAGPWLTFTGSRLLARRTGRAALLIAGRRLADNPKAGFRAVSGLALALFVTSVAIGIMTTMSAYDGGGKVDAAGRTVLLDDFTSFGPHLKVPAVPPTLATELQSVPGVHGVAVIRANSSPAPGAIAPGVMSCADLARVPAIGHCRPGAQVAMVDPYFGGRKGEVDRTAWPTADVAVAQLPSLPLKTIIVDAAGSSAAVERSRTVLEQAIPGFVPLTIAEQQALDNGTRLLHQYQQLA